jgi:hypothetical protein
MRILAGPLLLASAAVCAAQSGDDPQVAAARTELARVQSLVDAGVLPRAGLAKAGEALADALDAALLGRTAYGQDLTADQADEMVAAAQRRLGRRQKALDDARRLVTARAAAEISLKPFEDDVERERQECDVVDARARLVRELREMAGVEESFLNEMEHAPADSPEGVFAYATYAKVEVAFREHFGKALPVSAVGETAVHRTMGFDHRGRVDVAINPDQPEGVWLVDYLKRNGIPFFAFRQAVKGRATGAHIHIGPMSTRLPSGG